jgi:hypothetical protein
MLREIDNYFIQQEEPVKSCLLTLRQHILSVDQNIIEAWKYRMPFYCYHDKMFCYLWVHKQHKLPYLGLVDGKKLNHPELIIEKRSRMKIFLLNPEKDIPLQKINTILHAALKLRKH